MTNPFFASTSTAGDPDADRYSAQRLADLLVRHVEAVQQPRKAVSAIVTELVEHGLAVAHLAIHPGTSWIAAAATNDRIPVPDEECSVARPQAQALHEIIQLGTTQRWLLPPDTPDRERLLSLVFGDTQLTESIATAASRELLFFPLRARGRGFGLLAVAFGGSADLRSEAVGDLERAVRRIAVSLDTCALLAEGRYLASTMREAMIPAMPPLEHTELGMWSRIADSGLGLGGDCVAITGAEDDLSVVVADAMGKGVEAAVTAKRLHAAFRTAARVDRRPDWVLDIVNQVASDEPEEYAGFFTTAVCLRSRPQPDGRIHVDIASAGHCPPLVLRADGTVEMVGVRGPVLGLYPEPTFSSEQVVLSPGDALVAYTDGVTEAQSSDDVFGEPRLMREVSPLAGIRAAALAERLGLVVDDFADRLRDHDDRTVLVLRCPLDGRQDGAAASRADAVTAAAAVAGS